MTFLDQLRTYAPSDEAEAAHRERMIDLLTTAPDPFSRAHFAPGHFTASCYIVDGAGRLLLHHHRRLDRWLQMGGHVEAGESTALAALREGAEESGLRDLTLVSVMLSRADGEASQDATASHSEILRFAQDDAGIFDLDIHGIPAAKGEPDHDHFDVRYLARTASPHAITIDRAESNELAWVTLERAAELMHGPESHRVLRKIETLLRERSVS
jgi:8-oxo-dGTP pyrophosphatase MutT (NUDIX family)